MTHASLFSGIGGPDLAAERLGWENLFHCEINEFGRKTLEYYWPNSKSYDDITKTDFTIWRGKIDVLTGGFPCQPYSVAGKRLGKEDDRHLWPEMLRAIREASPKWVVGENVRGIVNWNGGMVFDEVQADLEAAGYEIQPFILPAAGVNAPHERYRVWFVARNTKYDGLSAAKKRRNDKEPPITPRKDEKRQPSGANSLQPSAGDASNANNNGHELREFGKDRSTPGASKIEGNKRQRLRDDVGRTGESENTSYTNNERLEGRGNNGILQTKKFTESEGFSPAQFNTITAGIGLRREGDGLGKTRFLDQASQGNYWENFPTQPPVCGGDDGLSAELVRRRIREDCMGHLSETEIDKIISKARTKFRNESIKAYGNAIVWQVIFQIFKAIEQYEKHEL